MSHKKEDKDKTGAVQCSVCGGWYTYRNSLEHLNRCIKTHPSAYVEGRDYVKCPECDLVAENLTFHLHLKHGWTKDKFEKSQIKLISTVSQDKWKMVIKNKYGCNYPMQNDGVFEKRRQKWKQNHGYNNPFASPAIQKRIKQTNIERYGVEYPMQNEKVFAKQFASANRGKTGLEEFFDEHITCDNVVFTGYGGRFLRTKDGVHKYGRVINDLNPDFMVFPDSIAAEAQALSEARQPMAKRWKFNSKYVVELLGDYYHSEKLIGVPKEQHEKEVVQAYKSIGIDCLVLWESDVMKRWEIIRPQVNAWLDKAIEDMNSKPEKKDRTIGKVDKREGHLECPCGSGIKFRSQEKLDRWMVSPKNVYRPGTIEGLDYVVCKICEKRFRKLTKHLLDKHAVSKNEYLKLYPEARVVAIREMDRIAAENRTKPKKGHYVKHVKYLLPDGTYAGKKDKWLRLWKGNPPENSKLVLASKQNSKDN